MTRDEQLQEAAHRLFRDDDFDLLIDNELGLRGDELGRSVGSGDTARIAISGVKLSAIQDFLATVRDYAGAHEMAISTRNAQEVEE